MVAGGLPHPHHHHITNQSIHLIKKMFEYAVRGGGGGGGGVFETLSIKGWVSRSPKMQLASIASRKKRKKGR